MMRTCDVCNASVVVARRTIIFVAEVESNLNSDRGENQSHEKWDPEPRPQGERHRMLQVALSTRRKRCLGSARLDAESDLRVKETK